MLGATATMKAIAAPTVNFVYRTPTKQLVRHDFVSLEPSDVTSTLARNCTAMTMAVQKPKSRVRKIKYVQREAARR